MFLFLYPAACSYTAVVVVTAGMAFSFVFRVPPPGWLLWAAAAGLFLDCVRYFVRGALNRYAETAGRKTAVPSVGEGENRC